VKKILWIIGIVVPLLIFFHAAWAEGDNTEEYPWAKGSVRLGGILTFLDSSVRIGLTDAIGIDVDVEDALGVDGTMWSLRGDALYRFTGNRRHRLDVSYAGYFREASRVLTEDLPIGEEVIEAGTQVDTTYNIQILKCVYSWSFLFDERVDVGIGGGLYIMPIKVTISPDDETEKGGDITAPLPAFSLHLDVAVTPKWYVRQRYNLFYLKIENYKGSILDIEIDIEYRFWKYAGVGLGWNAFDLRVQNDQSSDSMLNFNGKIETNYTGLLLYAKFFLP
jgi:hypothetical protein